MILRNIRVLHTGIEIMFFFLKLNTYTHIFSNPRGKTRRIEDKTAYNSTANQLSILNNCDLLGTLGTSAAEHKGCNWGMQIDWWLQPRAVFGHTFSGIIWHMPQK